MRDQGPTGIHEHELDPRSILAASHPDVIGVCKGGSLCPKAQHIPDPEVGEDAGGSRQDGVAWEELPRVSYRPGHCLT